MTDQPPRASIIDQVVQRANALYSLPAVAMEVLELTSHPKVDVPALKECLQNDPALTSKILRVVNSSLFGLSRQVSDLNQALALLGIKPLKLLVLGFSLPEKLFSDVEADILKRYWRKTLIKAVACREYSELAWDQPGDEAFIAGLLQDIGHLVLVRDLGSPYVRFVRKVLDEGGDQAAAETAALGFDQAALSARLLQHWRLPDALVRAVAQPYDISALQSLPDDQCRLPQALHLAELTAALLVDARQSALPELLKAGGVYAGLTFESIEELLEALAAKAPALADVFSFELGDADYHGLLLRSRAQLAEAGEQAAVDMLHERLAAEAADLAQAAQSAAANAAAPEQCVVPAAVGAAAFSAPQCDGAESTLGLTLLVDGCDPGLVGRVSAAIAGCRRQRCAASLLMVAIDDYETLTFTAGPQGAEQFAAIVQSLIDQAAEYPVASLRTGDVCFAAILEDCDRQSALDIARRVVREARDCAPRDAHGAGPKLTVSVGVATVAIPSKNFPHEELIDAATRCLYGAQNSGGDKCKSIEIF